MEQVSTVAARARAVPRISTQRAVVWVLFLFSGICGLIYEVLWCRHLGLLFGNTVQSMSAVLTAFMAGLALGSYVGGRVCHRLKRPMMVYGFLELAIGIYCAFLPWAFGANSPIIPFYRSLYGENGGGTSLSVARFAISFFLLLIPTTFMGATLPVLSQFLVRSKAFLGRTVGALYAVNTFGAVLGAALTGFVLLPMLGKANSNYIAVGANLILGTLAVIFGMKENSAEMKTNAGGPPAPQQNAGGPPAPQNAGWKPAVRDAGEPPAPQQAPVSALALKLAILTFGITGFAAMATQIGWTRAISLATGSSTYAFSLIVAVFIFGLSIGGVWGSRAAAKTHDPLALLGKLLLAIGLGCMALTAILGHGPQFFYLLTIWGSDRGWNTLLALQALGIGLLIVGPTFLMGATMPLTMQVAARTEGAPGRTVGTIYAVNTVGSILGSFLGGLVLLPWLQIAGTLKLMAVLYAAPGLVLYFMSKSGHDKTPRSEFMIVILAAATVLGVLTFAPGWDPLTMSSGMYLKRNDRINKAVRAGNWAMAFAVNADEKLLYYNEGSSATVAVKDILPPKKSAQADSSPEEIIDDDHVERSLSVGGKPDASSHHDMSTQLGLALVPLIMHESGPKNVLVIGLGSGASAAAALAPDSVESVDVVEMSPEVVEASYWFAEYTGLKYSERPEKKGSYWLDTPKLNLIVNDGRNHLLLTSKKYDVIASEPSNPWLAGVGNLFTRESFQLCRERLNPKGIMCQWIHCYSLEEDDFFNIVKTFGDVFPHIQLWCVNKLDFLLIGSDGPVHLPFDTLHERMRQAKVLPMLKKIDFDTEEEFLACFMSTDWELRWILSRREHAPVLHTDDNMLLEFSAPKALYFTKQLLRSTQFEPDPEYVSDLEGMLSGYRSSVEQALDLSAAGRAHWRSACEYTPTAKENRILADKLAPRHHWLNDDKIEIARAERENPTVVKEVEKEPEAMARARELSEKGEIDKAMTLLQDLSQELTAAKKSSYECVELAVKILRSHGRGNDALLMLDALQRSTPGFQSEPKAARLIAQAAELVQERNQPAKAMELAGIAETLAERDKREPLGIAGRILLAQKHFGQASDEFHHLTLVAPDNVDFKVGLADALIGMATNPERAPDVSVELLKLHHARRVSREAAFLSPDDAAAWARLAQAELILSLHDKPSLWEKSLSPEKAEELDKQSFLHHVGEALSAWDSIEKLDKAGLLTPLKREMESAEALEKAGLSASIPKLEELFSMDIKAFMRLYAMISLVKAK
ncbi:MAG TPA: fused MFS/spermidine synthase [Planctomycetota bacterium]|nr:fused MFS/spermidine synthase [Planctomycetota bacterium]